MKKWLFATTALAALSATPAPVQADPISMAVAAASTAMLGTGALTFTAFGVSLTGVSAAFAHFAIRATLGYALNALTKGQSGTAGRVYMTNALGPALPHQVIYGETKVGGAVFYRANTGGGNQYRHVCVAFAGHEIDSYQEIYLNDEQVTLDGSGNVTAPAAYVGARILTHLGADDQTADSTLVSEVTEWTTAHRARGVAYLYARYDTTQITDGEPVMTAVIRGKKVYDPREVSHDPDDDSTWVWSNNNALCIRDYLASDYGLSATSDELNDTAISTAADVCDEDVSGASRFTLNGAFTLDSQPDSIISAMLSSMAGMFWFAQGQWGMKAAKYEAPVLSLNQDDLRGPIEVATRNSRRQNFNTVRGIYRGSETNWQESDFTEVTNATYVTEDGGLEVAAELPLLFTDTDVMAQRIATISLKRNRKQISVTAPFGLEALKVGIGGTVKLTLTRRGWVDKVFEVNDWRFGMTPEMDIHVNLLLREIDSSVFT